MRQYVLINLKGPHQQDLQSVFNALPVGSRWDLFYPGPNHVVYYVLKEAEEDWARLELYLDAEF